MKRAGEFSKVKKEEEKESSSSTTSSHHENNRNVPMKGVVQSPPLKKVKTESSSSIQNLKPIVVSSSSNVNNTSNEQINNTNKISTSTNNNNNIKTESSTEQVAVPTVVSLSVPNIPNIPNIPNSITTSSSGNNIIFNTSTIVNTSTNSTSNSNTIAVGNRIRIAYNPDDIEVYLIWRLINDSSDDTKERNWKKVESTFIPSFSSSIHKQYMAHLAELNNTSNDSIRIGVMCKNKTNVNIALKFELDGKDYAFMSTTLKPREERLIRRLIHKTTKVSQTIQVKRNQIVESSSSASDQSLIEKLGTIKVKIFRIQVASESQASSSVASEQNITKTPDIKIREGMTKMKDLSVSFGTATKASSFQQTGFAYKEEIKTLEFIYHTRLGYLFELRKAGIDISNK